MDRSTGQIDGIVNNDSHRTIMAAMKKVMSPSSVAHIITKELANASTKLPPPVSTQSPSHSNPDSRANPTMLSSRHDECAS